MMIWFCLGGLLGLLHFTSENSQYPLPNLLDSALQQAASLRIWGLCDDVMKLLAKELLGGRRIKENHGEFKCRNAPATATVQRALWKLVGQIEWRLPLQRTVRLNGSLFQWSSMQQKVWLERVENINLLGQLWLRILSWLLTMFFSGSGLNAPISKKRKKIYIQYI